MGATFTRDHDGTRGRLMQFKGRKYDYHTPQSIRRVHLESAARVQEQIRNELVIGTLKSTCALTATLREGRKTVLFISEGLAATLPPGAYVSNNRFRPHRRPCPRRLSSKPRRQQAASGNLAGVLPGHRSLTRQRDVYQICTRGNTSVYPLDPRGLATGEFGAAMSSIRTRTDGSARGHRLASDSGGRDQRRGDHRHQLIRCPISRR
jgi:hypothetical protein